MIPARRKAMQHFLLGYITGSPKEVFKYEAIILFSEFASKCVYTPKISQLKQAIQLLYGQRRELQL